VPLIGREQPRQRLLSWAWEGESLGSGLLWGEGGIGKTRLAAEIAQQLADQGWITGFATTDLIPEGERVFLILDDIEEQPQRLDALLSALPQAEGRVRLLLIGRHPPESWHDAVDRSRAGRTWEGALVQLAAPAPKMQVEILREAMKAAATHFGRPLPDLPERRAALWLARSERHRLPLYACAAAIHAIFEGDEAFSLDATAVMESLVQRQLVRIDNAGDAGGWQRMAGSRLIGLAALGPGGFDSARLEEVANPILELGIPGSHRIVEAVKTLGWWSGRRLPAPEPGPVAAALLMKALGQEPNLAPEWLWGGLNPPDSGTLGRLARLSDDIAFLYGGTERRLDDWLMTMLQGRPQRARALMASAVPPPGGALSPFLAFSARLLVEEADTEAERAARLAALGRHAAAAGRPDEAAKAVQDAVDLYRQLLGEDLSLEPELAGALEELARHYGQAGRWFDAAWSAAEAVEMRRKEADS
ncbi:MAG: ATP-binding protein, partial [Rhodospirillales bacterium]|nr:ATP-binding protein [Rhodospirillales bacterium]